MKAVMLSIQPKYCELIASGKKTIEVRKTAPKLQTPFKCYIYCMKCNSERLLFILKDGDENYGEVYHGNTIFVKGETGSVCDMFYKMEKVIGEFVCEKVERYDYFIDKPLSELIKGEYRHYLTCNELEHTCLSAKEFEEYLGEKDGYGWHISDLKIYDTPKELGEFKHCCKHNRECDNCKYWGFQHVKKGGVELLCPIDIPLTRPPQSWCYVEEL